MKTCFYSSLIIISFFLVAEAHAQQCSGIPTAGTLTNLYPNTPVGGIDTLELSGNSVDSGTVTYWYASGPGCMPVNWIAIAGAIGNKLAVIVPNWHISYRVNVTCNNSGISSYTNVIAYNYGTCCNTTIWPGETNEDDTVNNNDVLPIVCRFGQTGPARNSASITWSPQYCNAWINTYGCINLMHLDCNGDGVINALDTTAISLNYDTLHVRQDEQPTVKINGIPDLYFDLSGIVFTPGANITIPIKFGSSTYPVHKLAAIAATLRISGLNLSVAPVINFDTSWLGGGIGNNTMHFAKKITNTKIDWTFGRIDNHNTNGYGILGSVNFTVPANAANGQQIYFQLEHVKAVDSNGAAISSFNVLADTGVIQTTGINLVGLPGQTFSVFPNPAQDYLHVRTNVQSENMMFTLFDITGKLLIQQYVNNDAMLDISGISPGLYLYRLFINGVSLQAGKFVKN